MLYALTVTSNIQMQNILDEVNIGFKLYGLVRYMALGTNTEKGNLVVAGRLFYKGCLVLPITSRFIQNILQEYHDGVM